jgi:gliding motility-associated-like protein
LTPFKPTHNYIPDITKPFDYKIATNFLETYTPQIRMGDYSSVKGQWIKIEQNYKSLTNEEFITIGNFSQSSFKITIQAPTKERNIGYFFIDDVSIIELPGIIAPDSTCYNEITALQSGLPGPFAWYKNNVLFSTDSIVYVTDTTNNWYHLHTPFGNDSLYLIIKDKPTLEVVPKITICQGDTINLKAVSNANDLVWLFNSSATNTTVTLAGTYVAIASRNGCLTQDTTIVSLVSKPQITINDEQFCSASLEKVNITLPIWYKYYWTTFNDSLYQRNIDSAAKYTIIIIDTNACKTQTSFNVIDMCSPIVFVPNAFVPNGVNSTFKPTFSYVKSVKLEIYNRWGNLVFSTTEQDQAWDGTFEGKAADTGTYIYNIIYTDSHNKEYQIKGNLSLIR